jgi:hypothetical protein
MDGYGSAAFIIFVFMVILGNFLCVNLVVAVVFQSYTQVQVRQHCSPCSTVFACLN